MQIGPLVLMVKGLVTGVWSLPGGEVAEGALADATARMSKRRTDLALSCVLSVALDQTLGGTFADTGETLTAVSGPA